jgi:carbonic anhydrase
MTALTDGNSRFVGGGVSCRNPQAEKALRHGLVEGQTPLAAILSCSDSRVPVEEIFDLNFGDIFSIRAAGSVPGVDQLGSIEYAVAHLGVPVVVVLAHTHCGAVTAAVQGADEPGNLGALLHKLDPITQAVSGVANADKITRAIYLSARRFSEQLPELSPVIKEALDSGKLTIVDAVYDLDTGQVLFHPQPQP